MKQYYIIEAYQNLEKLSENEALTDFDQWHIYKLRKLLRPHVEFQGERENMLREKYKPYANDEGMLSGDKAKEFTEEIQSLNSLDAEVESFEKPKIKLVKGITCKTIEALEDFIEFTEPAE